MQSFLVPYLVSNGSEYATITQYIPGQVNWVQAHTWRLLTKTLKVGGLCLIVMWLQSVIIPCIMPAYIYRLHQYRCVYEYANCTILCSRARAIPPQNTF